jgi:hypothetical protein
MLSNDDTSVSLPYGKFMPLGTGFVLAYAGDPGVLYRVQKQHVDQLNEQGLTYDSLDGVELAEGFAKAYASVRRSVIDETLAGRYGLSLEDLYSRGLQIFGEDKFHALCQEIEEYWLDLGLIIGGCSSKSKLWNLFRIQNPGTYRYQIMQGYDAVGSGAPIALGHLHACYQQFSPSLEWSLARLLEAKFMSESQRNVGRETYLLRFESGAPLTRIQDDKVQAYREKWEAQRQNIPGDWTAELSGGTIPQDFTKISQVEEGPDSIR